MLSLRVMQVVARYKELTHEQQLVVCDGVLSAVGQETVDKIVIALETAIAVVPLTCPNKYPVTSTEQAEFEKYCTRYGYAKADYLSRFKHRARQDPLILYGFLPNRDTRVCKVRTNRGAKYICRPDELVRVNNR